MGFYNDVILPRRCDLVMRDRRESNASFALCAIIGGTKSGKVFFRIAKARGWMASARSLSARVQAHRWAAVHEGVRRAMDHHSSGCLPAEEISHIRI
jgi:hypothetical protein